VTACLPGQPQKPGAALEWARFLRGPRRAAVPGDAYGTTGRLPNRGDLFAARPAWVQAAPRFQAAAGARVAAGPVAPEAVAG
jgi:hypothetical protein